MVKRLFLGLVCLIPALGLSQKPVGFLWYSLPKPMKAKVFKKEGIPFHQLSYTERDKVLRFYTMEALHKARATHAMNDMKIFLSLQQYWLNESTRFSSLFQKTLLFYPQYDYTVTHPTSHIGVKVTDNLRALKRRKALKHLAKTHGLLFFYRGNNPYDQQQIPMVRDFCKRFHFSLIPVSVNGVIAKALPFSRIDRGQAEALGVRFFPALLLANPTTQKTMPVSFGLSTQDMLEARLFLVATGFKGEAA